MSSREPLDDGAIVRLDRIGGSEFVVEMIELFLENAPQRLTAARDAYEEADLSALYRAVHSLKSTAANLGAQVLRATAEEAEARANDEDMDAIAPLLDDLESQWGDARDALQTERNRRKGAPGRTEESQ